VCKFSAGSGVCFGINRSVLNAAVDVSPNLIKHTHKTISYVSQD